MVTKSSSKRTARSEWLVPRPTGTRLHVLRCLTSYAVEIACYRLYGLTSMKNTREGRPSSPQRRVICESEQLSLDILALLASCGEPVRRTGLPAVRRVPDSLPAVSLGGSQCRLEDLPQRWRHD